MDLSFFDIIFAEVLWQQVVVLLILTTGLVLFMKDYWRYDVVALLIVVGVVLAGALPYTDALANFGHPAVVVVASMFVMSRALVQSGLVDATIGRMTFLQSRPIAALAVLVVLVTVLSAFVNNVGALAMVMPIAIHIARQSQTPIALFLLPLAFASHLGGFMTLIGTPRNLIISDFRFQATGEGFAMFDFFPVGSLLAVFGVMFLVFVAWRLIPVREKGAAEAIPLRVYTTEVVVPEKSRILKYSVDRLKRLNQDTIEFVRLFRNGTEMPIDASTIFQPNDHVIMQSNVSSLTQFVEKYKLQLSGLRAREHHVTNDDDQTTIEAIVPPYALATGRLWYSFPLVQRFGTNFIALSRRDHAPALALENISLQPGDVLLLRGRHGSVHDTMTALGLLPLDSRSQEEIPLGRPRRIVASCLIIFGAIALASLNIMPLAFVFLTAAVLLVVFDLVSLRQAYQSIDVSVLVLLVGMITLGDALQRSGAADTLASSLLSVSDLFGPAALLIMVLVASMIMSDFMNTTASVVVMGPIALLVAESLSVSIDPFLMAVAVGASCAFLTPVGHESNAIVMRKGGYNFRDYVRIGFPLELLIALITIPAILYFWPL